MSEGGNTRYPLQEIKRCTFKRKKVARGALHYCKDIISRCDTPLLHPPTKNGIKAPFFDDDRNNIEPTYHKLLAGEDPRMRAIATRNSQTGRYIASREVLFQGKSNDFTNRGFIIRDI
jgi:hypothetical protein